ncbi:hypothetical protein F0562_025545 [Nyssa sinensis]|uniref:Uncharacterized protein n=1 Tax=Nyssa sinensis TaxID=561372 RepID=A0A5J5B6I8_9ASTE|nr:hypothetical protein F0562_025545 [Nyssa sinensis]
MVSRCEKEWVGGGAFVEAIVRARKGVEGRVGGSMEVVIGGKFSAMGLEKALELCLNVGMGTVHRSTGTSGMVSTICSRALRRVAWGMKVLKLSCLLDIVSIKPF